MLTMVYGLHKALNPKVVVHYFTLGVFERKEGSSQVLSPLSLFGLRPSKGSNFKLRWRRRKFVRLSSIPLAPSTRKSNRKRGDGIGNGLEGSDTVNRADPIHLEAHSLGQTDGPSLNEEEQI
ncbi:hypothetical protein LguiA_012633 [Lonicera macranthoides]